MKEFLLAARVGVWGRFKRALEGLISVALLLGTVPRRRLWCWPCLVGGSGIFFVSVAAYAQASAAGPVALDAVTFFQYVATTAGGLSLAIAGWYMNRLDAKVEATRDSLMQNYLTKLEIRQLVEDLQEPVQREVHQCAESMSALHRRLDKFKVPAAASED